MELQSNTTKDTEMKHSTFCSLFILFVVGFSAPTMAEEIVPYPNYEESARANQKARIEKEKIAKQECGENYKSLHVGMSLDMVYKCVGPLKVIGRLHEADGVTEVYEWSNGWEGINEQKLTLYIKNKKVDHYFEKVHWAEHMVKDQTR